MNDCETINLQNISSKYYRYLEAMINFIVSFYLYKTLYKIE